MGEDSLAEWVLLYLCHVLLDYGLLVVIVAHDSHHTSVTFFTKVGLVPRQLW